MLRLTRTLLTATGFFGLAGTASADMGPDYISSPNVEFVTSFKPATGLTAGARVIGKYLYVTSSKDLEIFDISKPESPQLVSNLQANIQFENEEVPTNGKLLGISSDLLNTGPECLTAPPAGVNTVVGGGCLRLYDVRDPTAIKELPSVPGAGDHTSACILDCTYFYGSRGSIVDATKALQPGGRATKIGNWQDAVVKQVGPFTASCHNVNEFERGHIVTACNPSAVLTVLPEEGGSVLNPKVLATGRTPTDVKRFIHGAHWPNHGTDKFALLGGESNFRPQCGPVDGALSNNGAFMTFDASHIKTDGTYNLLDEIRPINGSYLDSNPPAQILGCSVHWFEEHPTFKDGGLVALAEYENGTRFLQVKPDGKILEQGYFVPLGGSTSAPHWAAPGSDILYAIDYERGIDVLRYKGSHYVPASAASTAAVTPEPGAVAGTEGAQPSPATKTAGAPASCQTSAGFTSASVQSTPRPGGSKHLDPEVPGPALRFHVVRREQRPFSVDVFQQSSGSRVIGNRLVAHFDRRTGDFTWDGRARGDRTVGSGLYFARFTMVLAGGRRDVRRVTLRRSAGRFTNQPAFYARPSCGPLSSFKLGSSAFGGAGKRSLPIAYRLGRGVGSVTVEVFDDSKLVKRFTGAGAVAHRTYRFSLPAGAVQRGREVRVRVTVTRANARVVSTLRARRL